MTIGEKIYRCRKANGCSQEELAALLGVSRQSVSKWETGDALPEVGKLLPMARCFQVTTDWLLDEEADYPCPPPAAGPATEGRGAAAEKTGGLYRKFGWLIGAVGLVYGVLMCAGFVPVFVGISQAIKSEAESSPDAVAISRAFLVVPVVFGVVALALVVGSVIFLIRFRKKYPKEKQEKAEP